MALTDAAIRNAKPTDKPYKEVLDVLPSGDEELMQSLLNLHEEQRKTEPATD